MATTDDAVPKVTCEITLEFPSNDAAAKVLGTVESDNDGYVRTRLDGNTVVASVEAESLNSLLHTLDDFLACVSVAEKIISR
ncbi:MAG TPA: KEOPS complex subunit Pcc1 [Thermoplasmata archaeon]|nr:KEOPS complex subunit Pcc1 [Thermoplasmata archaeon]